MGGWTQTPPCAAMIERRGFIQLPSAPLPALGPVVSSHGFPTFHQQIQIEEDASSGSSISRASSLEYTDDDEEYTDDDDEEEVSSIMESEDDDEDYPSDYPDSDMEVVPETTDERVLAHYANLKKFKDMRPELQDWINSWSEKKTPGATWLNVYGYCNKDKGYGGYGVILRNKWARPMIAATCFAREGGSQFFEVLSGLQTGLELAVKHGCLGLIVGCNVRKAVHFLDMFFQTAGACSLGADSSGHVKKNGICKDCAKRFVLVKDSTLETSIPVIAKLKDLHAKIGASKFIVLSKIARSQNEAAHCLAKMAKRDALKANRVLRTNSKVIKPADFPPKLGKILWYDAFGCATQYSHSLRPLMLRQ
ncbi:uncharacterized protein LOC113340677 [Papaver somniferum]|uniref:uncharacterized protein LOC113340677 n=1 Tax=Papaver somniferum TaxID=3469 RepID=UPI000E701BA3|nr:uncharacterized protein LOC113340677 [Papaver somniferum]